MNEEQDSSPFAVPKPEVMSATRAAHLQRIARVLEHIQQNLGLPLDLEGLARVGHLSPSHLNVVFRGLIGESVYQHIRRLRLERAASFLRTTNASVLDIALACGFESHEAFSRAFRQAFHCSPRTFRRRHHLPYHLPAPTNLHYQPEGPPRPFTPTPDLARSLEVRLVDLPALRLACYRRVGPYTQAHWAWPPLLWWAWRRGRLHAGTAFYGLSYDDDAVTPEQHQRYDAALLVECDFTGDGAIHVQTVEPGLYAVATARGTFADYWRLSEVFHCQWLPQSGLALRGLYTLERYHVHGNLLNPLVVFETALRDFHAEICLPVGPGPFDRSIHT